MATIIDPDDLVRTSTNAVSTPTGNLFIDPTATPPIIELISTTDGWSAGSGNLLVAADGVTGQALYSKLKELWKTEADLIKYPFPMEAITSEQFEFIANWELDDTNTASRSYIRSAGWTEKDAAASPNIKQSYMSVISLGNFVDEANQYAYYYWEGDTSPTKFTYPGPVNEAVQIFGDATHGNVDHTTGDAFTVGIRPDPTGVSGSVEGYTFNESNNTAIGATTLTYQAYRFPLSSVVDLNITKTDSEVVAIESARGLTIEYFATPQASNTFLSPDLFGGPYNFHVRIDASLGGATTEEIYNWVQYSLRNGFGSDQSSQTGNDIDSGAGTVYNHTVTGLVQFVGSNLETIDQLPLNNSDGGVAISGFASANTNDIKLRDDANVLQEFAFTATGTLQFNSNLVNDAAARYWMFDAGTFGTAGATTIIDTASQSIEGDVHYATYAVATGNTSGTTGASTAGSDVFTVTGETWTVDDLAGQILLINEGDASVDGYYFIESNTADTITLVRPIEGTLSNINWELRAKNTAGSKEWAFDWTTNGDTDITVVAIGLRTGQYVSADFQIGRATNQTFPITSPLERNYNDPV